ncbi:MAG TPA: pyridoxal-phosphate dependent enzyme, partial [Candidatus Elarobacter sp.]|nr:pyridoxal-phosphate dependent enzyme [Candidatus Elarobacter sp.]
MLRQAQHDRLDLTLADVDAAAALIAGVVPPTPAYRWALLNARLGVDLTLKHENHTPLGAFKVRGGLTYVDGLRRRAPHVERLVTATRGNHGQSIAFAAARAGLRATIVVPHGNSPEKNAAMRALGGELVVHGRDFDEARAQQRPAKRGRSGHDVAQERRCAVDVGERQLPGHGPSFGVRRGRARDRSRNDAR